MSPRLAFLIPVFLARAAFAEPVQTSSPPSNAGNVGPMPILFTGGGAVPSLFAGSSTDAIALEPAHVPELFGAVTEGPRALELFRPRIALDRGVHHLEHGLSGPEDLLVRIEEVDQPTETGFSSEMVLGDGGPLRIVLPEASRIEGQPGNFLLTFTGKEGASQKVLVAGFGEDGTQRSQMLISASTIGVAEDDFCAKVAGVSWSGAVGLELDLGCVEAGGCRCVNGGGASPAAFLLLLGLGMMRLASSFARRR